MKSLLALALVFTGCASNAQTASPPADARAGQAAAEEEPPGCEGQLEIAASAWRAYAIEMKHERLDVLVRGARTYADVAEVWAAQLREDHDSLAPWARHEARHANDAAERAEAERARRGQRVRVSTDRFVEALMDARGRATEAAAAARAGAFGDEMRARVLEADEAETRSMIAEAWVETSGMAANSIAVRGEPYVYGPSNALATETFTAANEASLAVMRSCPAPQLRRDEPEDDGPRRPMKWTVT